MAYLGDRRPRFHRITCALTIFEKIHLAELARIRASQALADLSSPDWQRRFHAEFDSAVCWMQHRCVTTESGNYTFPR